MSTPKCVPLTFTFRSGFFSLLGKDRRNFRLWRHLVFLPFMSLSGHVTSVRWRRRPLSWLGRGRDRAAKGQVNIYSLTPWCGHPPCTTMKKYGQTKNDHRWLTATVHHHWDGGLFTIVTERNFSEPLVLQYVMCGVTTDVGGVTVLDCLLFTYKKNKI